MTTAPNATHAPRYAPYGATIDAARHHNTHRITAPRQTQVHRHDACYNGATIHVTTAPRYTPKRHQDVSYDTRHAAPQYTQHGATMHPIPATRHTVASYTRWRRHDPRHTLYVRQHDILHNGGTIHATRRSGTVIQIIISSDAVRYNGAAVYCKTTPRYTAQRCRDTRSHCAVINAARRRLARDGGTMHGTHCVYDNTIYGTMTSRNMPHGASAPRYKL